MTQEQENDFNILKALSFQKNLTPFQLRVIYKAFGADDWLFLNKGNNQRYFETFEDAEYVLKMDSMLTDVERDINIYNISAAGKMYLKWLQKEKDKEAIDSKIKEITISNSKYQKWVPICSIGIAILSLITTISISLNKCGKQQLTLQEMQQLLQTQEKTQKSISNNLQEIKARSFQNSKSPDSSGK